MSQKSKNNETLNQIAEQARDVVQKGNQRHIVIRKQDGSEVVSFTFTVAAIAVVAMLIFQPLGTIFAIGALIYGITQKVRVEIVHDVNDDDDTVSL